VALGFFLQLIVAVIAYRIVTCYYLVVKHGCVSACMSTLRTVIHRVQKMHIISMNIFIKLRL